MRSLRWSPWLLSLAACSSVPPTICDTNSARQLGVSLAMRGVAPDYRAGAACPVEAFRKAVDEGYAEGKSRYCSIEEAGKQGFGDGEAARDARFDEKAYRICDNRVALKKAYHVKFALGRSALCSPERAEQSGKAYGGVGRAPEFPEAWARACQKASLESLKQRYLGAYHEALSDFCTGRSVPYQAESDGSAGRVLADLERQYGECPTEQRRKLQSTYSEAYRRGLGKYCNPNALGQEAEFQAQRTASSELPTAYVVCQPYFPDFQSRYTRLFLDARERVVAADCTYLRGEKQGAEDAARTSGKKPDAPSFCDTTHYPTYLDGYLDGWRAKKQSLCDRTTAYEQGRTDAKKGNAARYAAPALCPDELATEMLHAYHQGYDLRRVETQLGMDSR